jgi:hypothetical protein
MVRIRFARKDDIDRILDFLRIHWSENSILVKSRRIFDFQYCDGDECHFVIAADDETNEIYGLKGYVPLNRSENPDIAAALAIVLQGVRPMLGMEIEQFLEKETHSRWLCATGLNPNTSARVYKLFKNRYTVGTLKHYYRLADKPDYKIAKVTDKRIRPAAAGTAELRFFDSISALEPHFDIEAFRDNRPFKDMEYLRYRYFDHPVYEYFVMGAARPGEIKADALIIAREVGCNGSLVLRIVDYIGEPEILAEAGPALQKLMNERGYEYMDFYCYGLPHTVLEQAGFVYREDSDANIIPNYFEPFVQKNVDIHFFYTGSEGTARVFKADGDQDRPSMLPEGWME